MAVDFGIPQKQLVWNSQYPTGTIQQNVLPAAFETTFEARVTSVDARAKSGGSAAAFRVDVAAAVGRAISVAALTADAVFAASRGITSD